MVLIEPTDSCLLHKDRNFAVMRLPRVERCAAFQYVEGARAVNLYLHVYFRTLEITKKG